MSHWLSLSFFLFSIKQFHHKCPNFYSCTRAIADHLSRDHGMEISPKDVFLTLGGRQAIDIMLTVLARPGANILLPKPGYSFYEARATFSQLEIRHYDLLPEQGWEVDLSHVETLADDKTVAIAIINPGNPCGNVYTYEHLQKVKIECTYFP